MLYIITFVFGVWLGYTVVLFTKIKDLDNQCKEFTEICEKTIYECRERVDRANKSTELFNEMIDKHSDFVKQAIKCRFKDELGHPMEHNIAFVELTIAYNNLYKSIKK
jgi:hypothetical protein